MSPGRSASQCRPDGGGENASEEENEAEHQLVPFFGCAPPASDVFRLASRSASALSICARCSMRVEPLGGRCGGLRRQLLRLVDDIGDAALLEALLPCARSAPRCSCRPAHDRPCARARSTSGPTACGRRTWRRPARLRHRAWRARRRRVPGRGSQVIGTPSSCCLSSTARSSLPPASFFTAASSDAYLPPRSSARFRLASSSDEQDVAGRGVAVLLALDHRRPCWFRAASAWSRPARWRSGCRPASRPS